MTRVEGQTLSDAQRETADKIAEAFRQQANHVQEADTCAQDLLQLLPKLWAERGFSQEQSVFTIALVTIHLREKFPGGKVRFDAIAHEAHKHYTEQ